MTPDEALAEVALRASGRTQFEGRELPLDEVLAAEVKRLRTVADARCVRIINLTFERNAYRKALGRAAPVGAAELARQFAGEECE